MGIAVKFDCATVASYNFDEYDHNTMENPMTDSSVSKNDYRTVNSLDDCIAESHEKPVFIFKHSAICPTSTYAKREVDRFLNEDHPAVYLIVVQKERPLSNQVAETLGVRHESPQLLILREGKVKSVLNHHEITVSDIQGRLAL